MYSFIRQRGLEKAGIDPKTIICTIDFTINDEWSLQRGVNIAADLEHQLNSGFSEVPSLKPLVARTVVIGPGCINAFVVISVIAGIVATMQFLKQYKESSEGFDRLKQDILNIASRIKRTSDNKPVTIKKAEWPDVGKALRKGKIL